MRKSQANVYNPAIHHRRSIRLRGHDYSAHGVYFVTICVKKGAKDFSPLGTVVNGRMALNDAGRHAAQCWRDIPNHFPNVTLDEWVIMPDHVHGIIVIRREGQPGNNNAYDRGECGGEERGERFFAPATDPTSRPCGTSRTIGSIVRGFKIGVTKLLGGNSPWQRGYYDIIVRDSGALNNIRAYIRNNPANYNVHRYGEPRFFAGNRALLNLPMTAFLASRGAGLGKGERGERFFTPAFAPAHWPTQPQCVVSGFLSPMERAVFDACLTDGIPMVQILARGLPDRFPSRICRAIDAGNLLVITPFESNEDRFSAARASWCNQYALHLANAIVVGSLTEGGMLACLLADLPNEKPIVYLCADGEVHGV